MPSKNIILAVKSLGHALTDNSCACTCKKWLLKRMKVISIASWCEMHQVFGNGFDVGCRRPSRERTLHLLRWVETPYHQTCISVTKLSRWQERSVPELFSKRKHGSISRVQLVLIVCFEEEFSVWLTRLLCWVQPLSNDLSLFPYFHVLLKICNEPGCWSILLLS